MKIFLFNFSLKILTTVHLLMRLIMEINPPYYTGLYSNIFSLLSFYLPQVTAMLSLLVLLSITIVDPGYGQINPIPAPVTPVLNPTQLLLAGLLGAALLKKGAVVFKNN